MIVIDRVSLSTILGTVTSTTYRYRLVIDCKSKYIFRVLVLVLQEVAVPQPHENAGEHFGLKRGGFRGGRQQKECIFELPEPKQRLATYPAPRTLDAGLSDDRYR